MKKENETNHFFSLRFTRKWSVWIKSKELQPKLCLFMKIPKFIGNCLISHFILKLFLDKCQLLSGDFLNTFFMNWVQKIMIFTWSSAFVFMISFFFLLFGSWENGEERNDESRKQKRRFLGKTKLQVVCFFKIRNKEKSKNLVLLDNWMIEIVIKIGWQL